MERPESAAAYMVGYLWSYQFSELEGRLLTFVEMLGLSETQERAAKSQVRQLVWQLSDEAYYLPEDLQKSISGREDITQNKNRYYPALAQAELSVRTKKKRN